MIKVSIITVCLNSEETIEQTIQSVLGQTYPNIEYIIIDGVSTDKTLDIISKYEVTKLVSEKDSGIYEAMNKGLNLATGSIIGILNSDDWYEPDTVESVVTVFEQSKAHIIYGNINVWDKHNYVGVTKPRPLKELRTKMPIEHPATFVTEEVYKKHKFSTKYKVISDRELLLRLYSQGYQFTYLDKVLANFRLGGSCYINNTPFKRAINNTDISLHYATNLIDITRIAIRFFQILLTRR